MTSPIQFPSNTIREAQERGAHLLHQHHQDSFIEQPPVALAVEGHRWAWRPNFVRLILIAESHVHTSQDDIGHMVQRDRLPSMTEQAPAEFVRLVYCLGYGESWLLSGKPAQSNTGTIGFWDLFGRLAGTGAQPRGGQNVLAKKRDQRIDWKVETLRELRSRGIWLLDSSLHAIYQPNRIRLPADLAFRLHKEWWKSYGSGIVENAPTARVWAIGKTVAGTLGKLGCRVDGWIYQPNAYGPLMDKEKGWPGLEQEVQGLGSCAGHCVPDESSTEYINGNGGA